MTLTALKRFACALGWTPLSKRRHMAPGRVTIIWYESGVCTGGRCDCFLQINERPIGQQKTYEAAVYAPRFRLNSGWRRFTLSLAHPEREAERLAERLAKSHFDSPAARRAYRAKYPAAHGFSWAELRRRSPPRE